MTQSPRVIEFDTPLEKAESIMQLMQVRHLPVERQGKLVGILSGRNVKAALLSQEGHKFKAEDVMIPDPYVVPAHLELDLVAAAMAEEKYGSAIVQEEDGKVIGIFTTVDACRALREILETAFPQ